MTKHQVHWAAKHDWYITCSKKGYQFTVHVNDDMDGDCVLTFTNFHELYKWAGY
jgi:hypothetical protein